MLTLVTALREIDMSQTICRVVSLAHGDPGDAEARCRHVIWARSLQPSVV